MAKKINITNYDYIVSHFDGNKNDKDDIAALPIAAVITNSSDLQQKSVFFYNNNLSEANDNNQVKQMRKSAAFAKKLGIETVDYQANLSAATNRLVEIFNSGEKVLSIEGGPMEAVYRALAQTSKKNLSNITLISHSSWNENRDRGTKPGGGKPRTWKDLKNHFPDITFIDIVGQNGSGKTGFNNQDWNWLDKTKNSVLQEARSLMENAGHKVNDPSDAGMHFFAFTGNETGDPHDAKEYFRNNPPKFTSSNSQNKPPTSPTVPNVPTDNSDVYQGKNGQIIIEAENTKLEGDWEKITIKGRQGVLYDGRNSFRQVPSGQTLEYNFQTDESGKYNIALHSARHKAAMQNFRHDLGNDIWLEIIDSQTNKTIQKPIKLFTSFGSANDEYRWGVKFDAKHKKSDAAVNLQANREYTLRISGRSDGYVLDRITLSNDGFLKNANIAESIQGEETTTEPDEKPPCPCTQKPDNSNDNIIYGTKKDDEIIGTDRDDIIYGTTGKSNGKGDIDTLTGGQGADTFVLGEEHKVYFNDRIDNTVGRNDYAVITDFSLSEGDQIQLGRELKNYRLGSVNGLDGQAVFLKTRGQDELIAIVENETNLNLDSEAFTFV